MIYNLKSHLSQARLILKFNIVSRKIILKKKKETTEIYEKFEKIYME